MYKFTTENVNFAFPDDFYSNSSCEGTAVSAQIFNVVYVKIVF